MRPLNALERDADLSARWRYFVNAELAGNYARLWRRIEKLIVLQTPDFNVVRSWRDEQELSLRQRGAPHARTPQALREFIAYYERVSRHALASLPALADVRVLLDRKRTIKNVGYVAETITTRQKSARRASTGAATSAATPARKPTRPK